MKKLIACVLVLSAAICTVEGGKKDKNDIKGKKGNTKNKEKQVDQKKKKPTKGDYTPTFTIEHQKKPQRLSEICKDRDSDQEGSDFQTKETLEGKNSVAQENLRKIVASNIIKYHSEQKSLSSEDQTHLDRLLNKNAQEKEILDGKDLACKTIQDFNDEKDNEFFIELENGMNNPGKGKVEEPNQRPQESEGRYKRYIPHIGIAATAITLTYMAYHYRNPLKENMIALKNRLAKLVSF